MLKEVLIGGIKVRVSTTDDFNFEEPATLALQVHGRTRNHTDCVKFARYLLAEVPNLICVTWDLPNHGARLISAEANDGWNEGNPLHLVQMQAVIEQGAAEAESILRSIECYLPECRIAQKVIIGVSLGGYITWKVASECRDLIAAAVPIISSPDLPAVMRYRWAELEKTEPEAAKKMVDSALPPKVMAGLETTVVRVKQLRETELPILAICGGADPLVPPQYTVEWGKSSKPNQKVEIVPNVKHEVVREMIDLVAEYLYSLVSRTGLQRR